MDAGCSEACSNKRRVSNKRRSDRSALDAGGCSVNNINNNPCTMTTSQSQSKWNQETTSELLKTLRTYNVLVAANILALYR